MFTRGGSFLPLNGSNTDERTILVFPPPQGHGRWEFELIEDDGVSWGPRTRICLVMQVTRSNVISIDVEFLEREFEVGFSVVWFVFAPEEQREVDGHNVSMERETSEGSRSYGIPI